MILVPEAYQNKPIMTQKPKLKAFYEYYESLQEAWDGPALLVFSDGDYVGASLDRNGLRPARCVLLILSLLILYHINLTYIPYICTIYLHVWLDIW